MEPTNGPEGMNLRGSLEWLFSADKDVCTEPWEADRPHGVPLAASGALAEASGELQLFSKDRSEVRALELWPEGASFADNADLLLDEELLSDFKAVPLVKRQLRIKHQERLFEQLHNQELMVAAKFSMRCVPAERPQQVVAFAGKTAKLGNMLPTHWLLRVYFEEKDRAKVEQAFEQLGYRISASKELPAAEDVMEQLLAHQHSLGRFSFFAQLNADESEVTDGKSLDEDLREWRQSYEE
mmetsp:Transcript_7802/g.13861  ORF Transcript_7802/g.13861 Transcript_7802/m.13861 type:complete len:240 (-) Transcript_7802:123-842(-)